MPLIQAQEKGINEKLQAKGRLARRKANFSFQILGKSHHWPWGGDKQRWEWVNFLPLGGSEAATTFLWRYRWCKLHPYITEEEKQINFHITEEEEQVNSHPCMCLQHLCACSISGAGWQEKKNEDRWSILISIFFLLLLWQSNWVLSK